MWMVYVLVIYAHFSPAVIQQRSLGCPLAGGNLLWVVTATFRSLRLPRWLFYTCREWLLLAVLYKWWSLASCVSPLSTLRNPVCSCSQDTKLNLVSVFDKKSQCLLQVGAFLVCGECCHVFKNNESWFQVHANIEEVCGSWPLKVQDTEFFINKFMMRGADSICK